MPVHKRRTHDFGHYKAYGGIKQQWIGLAYGHGYSGLEVAECAKDWRHHRDETCKIPAARQNKLGSGKGATTLSISLPLSRVTE